MNLIPVISVENMRQSDAKTIADGVASKVLMRRAAEGIFNAAQFRGRVGIVCGSGNNGGDGYALACVLLEHGITPTIFRVSEKFSADGMYYYHSAMSLGAEEGNINAPSPLTGFDIVVDCLLGTGFSGEVSGAYLRAIDEINACTAFVISADINSGLNGDTGVAQTAVKSDLTVSIGAFKTGMFLNDAPNYIDKLRNADIGIAPVRREHFLIDFDTLPLFEGYGSEVLSPEEFYERTGFAPEECDVPRVLAELSAEERKPYVVKTERSAVIADIRFVYFCADYVF